MSALLERGALVGKGSLPLRRRCPGDRRAGASAGRANIRTRAQSKDEASVSPGLKAVWYAAENFGKLVALGKQPQTPEPAEQAVPVTPALSRTEAIASIREDYDKDYFISGAGDMAAYAPDCEFSDPFVAFRGVKRFQTNVGNLGRLMRDVKLDVYEFTETGRYEVATRWRFSCLLDLPWRPRIAAAGNTTHVLDPNTFQCIRHIERWEVEPEKVIRQLFRPAARVPENAWETFVMSLSDGDVKGMWWVLSPMLLRIGVPVLLADALVHLVTGDGLPVGLEAASVFVLVSAAVTQVLKFAQGMQGGETGTGGRF